MHIKAKTAWSTWAQQVCRKTQLRMRSASQRAQQVSCNVAACMLSRLFKQVQIIAHLLAAFDQADRMRADALLLLLQQKHKCCGHSMWAANVTTGSYCCSTASLLTTSRRLQCPTCQHAKPGTQERRHQVSTSRVVCAAPHLQL